MLVLTRKKHESIVINENIKIEVLQINGKQIRLGITAPSTMKILRGELPVIDQPAASHAGRGASRSEAKMPQQVLELETPYITPASVL